MVIKGGTVKKVSYAMLMPFVEMLMPFCGFLVVPFCGQLSFKNLLCL